MGTPTVSFDYGALGAVVMLAGGPVPTPLAAGLGCSVLDLPLSGGRTVMGHWLDLLRDAGVMDAGVPVRAVHSEGAAAPTLSERARGRVEVVVETDAYRGPAGAVRDAIAGMDPRRSALIIEAARYHGAGLGEVLARAGADPVDLLVTCNADHTPAGVYLMRGAAFDHVPSTGYMDLKEQLIERLVSVGDIVRVADHGSVVSVPIRTRREMLAAAALSAGGQTLAGSSRVLGPERWESVVSPGARVAPSAVVHESVVMEGAVVPDQAVVARSVIGRGAQLNEGDAVVDRVVGAGSAAGRAVSSGRRGRGVRWLLERMVTARAART